MTISNFPTKIFVFWIDGQKLLDCRSPDITIQVLACASRTARPSGAGRRVRSDKRGSLRSQGRPDRVLARIYVVRFAHRASRTVCSEVIIEVMDFKGSRMAMKIVQRDNNSKIEENWIFYFSDLSWPQRSCLRSYNSKGQGWKLFSTIRFEKLSKI